MVVIEVVLTCQVSAFTDDWRAAQNQRRWREKKQRRNKVSKKISQNSLCLWQLICVSNVYRSNCRRKDCSVFSLHTVHTFSFWMMSHSGFDSWALLLHVQYIQTGGKWVYILISHITQWGLHAQSCITMWCIVRLLCLGIDVTASVRVRECVYANVHAYTFIFDSRNKNCIEDTVRRTWYFVSAAGRSRIPGAT